MRIMGLDYGDKTVGVAVSDPLLTMASGLEIIRRDEELSLRKSVRRLAELVKEYEISTIVLGYPKNMDGSEGFRCEKTTHFKAKLERNFKKIPVVLWDERLSTVGAERSLMEGGLTREQRKLVIDKMAAVFILQGYLDFIRIRGVQDE